jgi:hypothetical protein
MRENVLSFMLGNLQQIKGFYFYPGSLRMHNEELVKEVLIYLEGDLYLDILTYLDNSPSLTLVVYGDDFSLIGNDDL